MKWLIILWMIVVLLDFSGAQCISNCPDGTGLLFPLSYNTMRSHVFNGTQPSNEGCTNGVSIDGQVTIECGQGTTLIDCDRGFNGDNYSNIPGTFTWNRTTSVDQQVSIMFRFDQQINISRISMFFWNSQSNSIIVPNVMMYWSNDNSITPSNVISITPGSPNRNGDRRNRLNVDINDVGLQFQYLRIVMSFYDDSEWIFLSDVQFCGNEAPYRITQSSTDNDVQIVSPTTTATLTCSLNVTIPSSVIVTWTHNNTILIPDGQVSTASSTTTLTIKNLQSSNTGVYECVFNDTAGYTLRRRITLLTSVPQVIQPPVDFYTVTFDESTDSVQLMCSLNIDIPSSVTFTWTYNSNTFNLGPYDTITQDGSTAALVIGDPQQSDAGLYQCSFIGFYEESITRFIQLDFRNTTTISTFNSVINVASSTETSVIFKSDTKSADHSTHTTFGIAFIATSIQILSTTKSSDPSITTTISTNTDLASQSDDNSSSVGVIVAIVVLVVVVFIIITVVVVGIIVVWKRKKSEQHTKQEGVYYTTIDETIKRSPANKPEPVYSKMNDGQDNKDQYMDISKSVHSTTQQINMQDNPAYSISSEQQVNMQDNPAYSTSSEQQVKMQDNPAYAVSSEHRTKVQDDPYYV